MINIFYLDNEKLEQVQLAEDDPLPQNPIWVDLISPSTETRRRIEATYHIELPDEDEIREIEATSRFFLDEDGMHIHSLYLQDFEETPESVTVAFILKKGCLYTYRAQKLATFRLFRLATRRRPELARNATCILLTLFENKIDHLADVLESTYSGLNDVSQSVLGQQEDESMEEQLEAIAKFEDITGKARLSLLDAQRAVSFIQRNSRLDAEAVEQSHDLMRDIDSLLQHTSFLFNKVNFLMDAVQGFINIEQNQIIKIFSIAAVVFLPPTMVASIYGMNFHIMPELSWEFGYPMALLLILLSGIAPYWYFKRRGWL
jgi:magnesium transporter